MPCLKSATSGSAIGGVLRSFQQQLVESQVKPAAKLEPNLRKRANALETVSFMQGYAGGVICIDGAHDSVLARDLGSLHNFGEQVLAQPLTAVIRVNVNRMLNRVLVGGVSPEGAKAGEAKKFPVGVLHTDDGKTTGSFGGEPGHHRFASARLVVVEGRRSDDGMVQDVENGGAMSLETALHQLSLFRHVTSLICCRGFTSGASSRINTRLTVTNEFGAPMAFSAKTKLVTALTVTAALMVSGVSLPAMATTFPNGDLVSFDTTADKTELVIPGGLNTVTFTDTQVCNNNAQIPGFWYNTIQGPADGHNDDISGNAVVNGNTISTTATYTFTVPGEYHASSYAPACGVWNDPLAPVADYFHANEAVVYVYDTPVFGTTNFGNTQVGTYTDWSSYAGYGATYSITAGVLPDGLSLDSNTGEITGTPTTSAAYDFTVTATNPAGTVSQQYTGSVESIYINADETTIYNGDAVTFTTNASPGAHAAFFVNGQYWGDGRVDDTPNPFAWDILGCNADAVGTYRVYNEPAEGSSQPNWDTPYLASVDVTFKADPSAASCFGSLDTNPWTLSANTISQGETISLSYNGQGSYASCYALDGLYIFCTPAQQINEEPVTWDQIEQIIVGLQQDPTVSHTFRFATFKLSDIENGTGKVKDGASPLYTADIEVFPAGGPTVEPVTTGSFSLDNSGKSATVNWTPSQGAVSYKVIVGGQTLATVDANVNSYTVPGLFGPADTISVVAVDGNGNESVATSLNYVKKGFIAVGGIKFLANSAKLTTATKKALREYAKTVAKHGFTSVHALAYFKNSAGYSTAFKKSLLKQRAAAISRYLKAAFKKLGVNVKVTAKPAGSKDRLGVVGTR